MCLGCLQDQSARWGPSIPPSVHARAGCAPEQNTRPAPELDLVAELLVGSRFNRLHVMLLRFDCPLRNGSSRGSKYSGCCDRSSAPASPKIGRILYGKCGVLATRLLREQDTPDCDPLLLGGQGCVLAASRIDQLAGVQVFRPLWYLKRHALQSKTPSLPQTWLCWPGGCIDRPPTACIRCPCLLTAL